MEDEEFNTNNKAELSYDQHLRGRFRKFCQAPLGTRNQLSAPASKRWFFKERYENKSQLFERLKSRVLVFRPLKR